MIPERKKTPEEIDALRGDLGIREPAVKEPESPAPEPDSPPEEPVIHLEVPATPKVVTRAPQAHSLRKHELPLAPAAPVANKTRLPTNRHDPGAIAQLRKREALAQIESKAKDPAARLRAQTASPFLYVPGYLLALSAAAAAYQRVHHITPISLLGLSLLVTIFIAVRKPRSRHHAALIFIVIFLTAALGAIHYAPLFQHVP